MLKILHLGKLLLLIAMPVCSQVSAVSNHIDSLFKIWNSPRLSAQVRLESLDKILSDRFSWVAMHADSAKMLSLLMYDLALECGSKKHQVNGLIYMAKYRFGIIDFSKSIALYNQALRLAEEINDISGQAAVYSALAVIAYQARDVDQFFVYQEKALTLWRQTGNEREIAWALHNMGYAFQERGSYRKAIGYYNESLVLSRKIGHIVAMANCYAYLGEAWQLLGAYNKAQQYFTQSLAFKKKHHIDWEMEWTMVKMGEGLIALKEYKKAAETCSTAYAMTQAKPNGAEEDAMRYACKCLYMSYKEMGDPDKALTFYEKWSSLNDSLEKAQTAKLLQQAEFSKQLLRDSLAQSENQCRIEDAHRDEVSRKNQVRNIIIIVALFILLAAAALFNRLLFTRKAKAEVEREKKKSEDLLLNILPAEVANELKQSGEAVAKQYNHVTVLFTDFVGFTTISEQLSPTELVAEIHRNFTAFDAIMEKHGLEKIKTIGDAYMAVCGLPNEATDHAQRVVSAALDIQQYVNGSKGRFQIRIGINSGPVVAGIVGVKKYAYDIWGDTVNTAARMEQNSEAGKINISGSTYELIKDEFVCESRGKVRVKNKGEIEMYFVERKNK